jgi:hypothetical protein
MELMRDFVLAAGGAFGGGFVVLAGEQLLSYFRRPIINTSFDRNKHDAVVITVKTTTTVGAGAAMRQTEKPGTYFRLNVANNGQSTARGCEVAIEKIVRTRPSSYEYKNDPIRLGWSLLGTYSVDLHPTTSRYCDVLVVRDDYFAIAGRGNIPNYLEEDLAQSFNGAEFLITLRVSGDNFPSKALTIVCGWIAGVQNIVAREASDITQTESVPIHPMG